MNQAAFIVQKYIQEPKCQCTCFPLYNRQDFYLTMSNIEMAYIDGSIDYCSDCGIIVFEAT